MKTAYIIKGMNDEGGWDAMSYNENESVARNKFRALTLRHPNAECKLIKLTEEILCESPNSDAGSAKQ